jgi:hypothetical protein
LGHSNGPIHYRSSSYDSRTRGLQNFNSFACGTTSSNNIFDHQSWLALPNPKATPQCHRALLTLGPNEPGLQSPGYFMPDYDSSESRRGHQLDPFLGVFRRYGFAEPLGFGRILENECGLKVRGAVQATREDEMAFQ